jgi:hypothetical protein
VGAESVLTAGELLAGGVAMRHVLRELRVGRLDHDRAAAVVGAAARHLRIAVTRRTALEPAPRHVVEDLLAHAPIRHLAAASNGRAWLVFVVVVYGPSTGLVVRHQVILFVGLRG